MSWEVLTRHKPGEVRLVTSPANEAIKAIRSLEMRKEREASGLFLAEGARTLLEAIELGAELAVVAYLGTARDEPHVKRIADGVRRRGGLTLEVDRTSLEKISRRENPQTVIGVLRQAWTSLDQLEIAGPRALILEQVRDPGNLGTILRTADGFGVTAVVLAGDCVDPFGLEAVRASMGSLFAVKLARASSAEAVAWAKARGAKLVGTHLQGAVDIRRVAWRDPSVIVMGNEQKGLTEELAAACDELCLIPMSGRADSFNLAIATAVTLYESVRGR